MYELLSTYTDGLALSHTTLPTPLLQTHAHIAAIPSPPVATYPLSPEYNQCHRSKVRKWQCPHRQVVLLSQQEYPSTKNPTAPVPSLLASHVRTVHHPAHARSRIQLKVHLSYTLSKPTTFPSRPMLEHPPTATNGTPQVHEAIQLIAYKILSILQRGDGDHKGRHYYTMVRPLHCQNVS